jgi:hypothetical protein
LHITNKHLSFTGFVTDADDQPNSVFDKVFMNLNDFGSWFAKGYAVVPNVYGPILLRIRPETLICATDVAISPRSAGSIGSDRQKDSLESVYQVDRLCQYPSSHYTYTSAICAPDELEVRFRIAHPSSPEVSCLVEGGLIPLLFVESIVVDPYRYPAIPQNLITCVSRIVSGFGYTAQLLSRSCSDLSRYRLYNEIASRISRYDNIQDVIRQSASHHWYSWLDQVEGNDIEYQLRNFIRYLATGTIRSPWLGQTAEDVD